MSTDKYNFPFFSDLAIFVLSMSDKQMLPVYSVFIINKARVDVAGSTL